MGDLISRKALIEQIKLANNRSQLGETVNGFNLTGIEVVGLINDMPTAYDVDKVAERLTEGLDSILYNRCYNADYQFGMSEVQDLLKSVLKGAAKDE